MRRMGESELAQDPPRRVVQQLLAAALSGSKAREKIPALFVSTASPAEMAAALEVALSGRSSGIGDGPREPGPAAADRRRRAVQSEIDGRRRCDQGIPRST